MHGTVFFCPEFSTSFKRKTVRSGKCSYPVGSSHKQVSS